MLTISGMKNFYYIPEFTDMRCKAERISQIIHRKYNRNPFNGDVFIFMSRDRRKIKLIRYEAHAYYLHEKSFTQRYKSMRLEEIFSFVTFLQNHLEEKFARNENIKIRLDNMFDHLVKSQKTNEYNAKELSRLIEVSKSQRE